MADQAWWIEFMESIKPALKDSLANKRPFDQWYASALDWVKTTATNGNVKWGAVTKIDIESAFIAAAKNGLMVDGHECMIMVRGRKDPKVRCEIGAGGVIRQAGDAGIRLNSRTIREGDKIKLDEGAGIVHHTPAWLAGGKAGGGTLGYYAVAVYRDGRQVVRSMSYDEAQSRAASYGPWQSHPDQMGEKTMILNIRKVLYFGDEIEGLISSSGVETGGDWALADAAEEAAREPQHPPQSTRDKVLAQAARDEQDAAAEGAQEPEPQNQPPSGPAAERKSAHEEQEREMSTGGPI